MAIMVFGLSHKTAPIELRERLALDEPTLEAAYRGFRNVPGLEEVVLLSTCNRVEVYAHASNETAARKAVCDFMAALDRRHAAKIKKALYEHSGESAISHLLKVASSMDSMVVGESQILGQVKAAYQRANEAGTVSKTFHGLFHRIFTAAKEVRSSTDIGKHPASVPSVAVNLAEQVFGDLSHCKALLIGAGEMAELCAQYLKSAGTTHLVVANRTLSKAQSLAELFGARPAGLDKLEDLLIEADVVLMSAAGKSPLVTRAHVEAAAKYRAGKPQLLVDISVPRGVEATVDELDMVYLYNVDDLQKLAERAWGKRMEAGREADHLLAAQKRAILDWLGTGQVDPTIQALQKRLEDLRESELLKARRKLGHLNEADWQRVEYLSQALVKKILHTPVTRLRDRKNSARNIESLSDLFDLDNKDGA